MTMVNLGFGLLGESGQILPQFEFTTTTPSREHNEVEGPSPNSNCPKINLHIPPNLVNNNNSQTQSPGQLPPGLIVSLTYHPENGGVVLTLKNIAENEIPPAAVVADKNLQSNSRASDCHRRLSQSSQISCKRCNISCQNTGCCTAGTGTDPTGGDRVGDARHDSGENDDDGIDRRCSMSSSLGSESEVDIDFLDDSISGQIIHQAINNSNLQGGNSHNNMSATTTIKSNRPSCRISKSRCSLSRSPSLAQSHDHDLHEHHGEKPKLLQQQTPQSQKHYKTCNYYRNKMSRASQSLGESPFPNAEQEFWLNFGALQHSAAQKVVKKMAAEQKLLEQNHHEKQRKFNYGGSIHIYSNSNHSNLNLNNQNQNQNPAHHKSTTSLSTNGLGHSHRHTPECHHHTGNDNHSCYKKKPTKLDPLQVPFSMMSLQKSQGFGDLIHIAIEK